jgi:hypothetical protein
MATGAGGGKQRLKEPPVKVAANKPRPGKAAPGKAIAKPVKGSGRA